MFVWGDVSGTVGGGGNDGSNGRWTVVSSDIGFLDVGAHLSLLAIMPFIESCEELVPSFQ